MRLIDAEFEENHYASMLLNPTPDVTEEDKHKARIIIDALRMSKTVEPKRGKWRHYEGVLKCSECASEFYDTIMEICGDDVPHFCPDCGAKMGVK